MVDAVHCRRLGWTGLGDALARSIHALFNAARAIYGDLLCFNPVYHQYRLAGPGIGSVWNSPAHRDHRDFGVHVRGGTVDVANAVSGSLSPGSGCFTDGRGELS